ncbi:hypothetical protein [Enterobacter asburiae]|uniref:hypothetical protein n=1 Tax=Enterobacter asburiae TaxID=61645 RepID=UPI0021D18750|nr:hypothetical protein [Enterobacter asburiae]MCU6240802.1 hypothetical protein [Enterobacter asburiae]
MITGFGNNVVSSLASDITAGQTTILVMPGAGSLFEGLLSSDYENPSNSLSTYAKLTLTDSKETSFEVCHLISVSNDVLTVIRGQEGTTAKGWSLNDVIANFATRGSENQFVQIDHLQSGFYCAGVAEGTENALMLHLPSSFFLNGSTDWMLRTPVIVYPTLDNTGAATLQLVLGGTVLGTFPLYKGNKKQLVAGDILKDSALVCLLDKSQSFFSVMNPGAIYAGLGTAAFANIVTSMTDTTAGRVPVVGWEGLGGYALQTTDAEIQSPNRLPTRFFIQGNGDADKRFGHFGSGVHIEYGTDGNGVEYSANMFVRADGNIIVEWLQVNADGSVNDQKQQMLYGPLNKPTAADCDAVSAGGGDYNATFAFGGVGTIGQERNASELFSQQGNNGTIVSGVRHHWYDDVIEAGVMRGPGEAAIGYAIYLNDSSLFSIDANGNAGFKGNAVSGGPIISLQGDERKHFAIFNANGTARAWIYKDKGGDGLRFTNGDDGGGDFVMGKNGEFSSPSHIHAGGATLNANGDVYGTIWNGWLSNYLNARTPTLFRVGARTKVGNLHAVGDWSGQVPQGAINIASLTEGDDRITSMYYAYPQYLVNGNWVNFA